MREVICVFDSGIGGAFVINTLMHKIEGEHFLYLADNRLAPYGNKSASQIFNSICLIIDKVLKKNKIKMLVLACNTATACAIKRLRQRYCFLIVGMEPAILPALKKYASKDIFLLATTATINNSKLIKKIIIKNKINYLGLSNFAKNIENNIYKLNKIKLDKNLINKLLKNKYKAIVLGCSHYRFVKPLFYNILGDFCEYFYTDDYVCERALFLLKNNCLINNKNNHKKNALKIILTKKSIKYKIEIKYAIKLANKL